MRISMTVTEEDCRPTQIGIDPAAPGYGAHLPFYLILQRSGLAWRDFLISLDGFDDGVIVPHLTADFSAEVLIGDLAVDVVVIQIGRTSFTVRCTFSQHEVEAARVDVVLVNFDYDGGAKVPLTEVQRAQLESVLV